MGSRRRARAPDRKTTRLMRSVAALNSKRPGRVDRALSYILEECGPEVFAYVTRSLGSHSKKHRWHYLIVDNFDAYRALIWHEVWVLVILKGRFFYHRDRREFRRKFLNWLSACCAYKTKELLWGMERNESRYESLDSDDSSDSDEEGERRPKRLYFVGGPHSLEDEAFGNDRLAIVMDAIAHLSLSDQHLILRRYFFDYSYAELHVLTGQSYAALRTRLNRIRRRLRAILQEMLASTD